MNNELLQIAIEKVNDLAGIDCEAMMLNKHGNSADAEITLIHNNTSLTYLAQTKQKIVPQQVALFTAQTSIDLPTLLVADYITPRAKSLLKDRNISYVDTAGNMFLNHQGLYVYIQTHTNNRQKLKTNTSAFNKAGLKVVFQFLVHPEYLNKPYRFIGKKAKVAIATVGKVIQGLLREKFLIRVDKKTYQFTDRKRLFEQWVNVYSTTLKPKLKQKKYRWLSKNTDWKTIELPNKTYWGGANAAELLTNYLIADHTTIYTHLPFQEVMKTLKIIPDSKGTIAVVESFWGYEMIDSQWVSPILVYADLLSNPTPRHIETAHKIYKNDVQYKL